MDSYQRNDGPSWSLRTAGSETCASLQVANVRPVVEHGYPVPGCWLLLLRLSWLLSSRPSGPCRPPTSTDLDTLSNGTNPVTRITRSGPFGSRTGGRKCGCPGTAHGGLHVQLLHNTGLAGREVQTAVISVPHRGRFPRAQPSFRGLPGAEVLIKQRNSSRRMAQLLGEPDEHEPTVPRCLSDGQQQLGRFVPPQRHLDLQRPEPEQAVRIASLAPSVGCAVLTPPGSPSPPSPTIRPP